MDFNIRPAQLSDLPRIQRVQARALRELTKGHYTPVEIESLVRSQQVKLWQLLPVVGFPVYVAECHQRIVGVASLVGSTIAALFVHPEFARQGIATRLIQQLEATSHQKRYRQLYVMSSLMAVPFYQAVGFQSELETHLISGGRKIGCVHMRKNLSANAPQRSRFEQIFGGLPLWLLLLVAAGVCLTALT